MSKKIISISPRTHKLLKSIKEILKTGEGKASSFDDVIVELAKKAGFVKEELLGGDPNSS